MKKLWVVVIAALFAGTIEVSHAQKPGIILSDDPGWTHIGETVASFRSESESIMVIGADEFNAIKIKVDHAPLEIDRLQVFYSSGEMEEIDIKKQIRAGEESEVFQLKNPEGGIQKVAFTYNTASNSAGEKADVELWGLKSDDEDRASDAYRDDAGQVEEGVNEAGDNIERETEEAGDNIEQGAERTERDFEQSAEAAGEDIERETEEAGDNIERGAERTESDFEQSAETAGEDIERETEEAGDNVEQGAEETESDLERAGHAIAETAAKGAAEITDKRHDTKVGPDGQTIYVDDSPKYYYVNDRGKRVPVSESELKDKH